MKNFRSLRNFEALVNAHLNGYCKHAILQGNGQVVNATNVRSTLTIKDGHLRAGHAKKKKDRTTEFRKWQSHGVKIN